MICFRSPDDVGRVLGLHPRAILPALRLLTPSHRRFVSSGAGAFARAALDGRLLMLIGAIGLITMIVLLLIFDGPSGLWLLMLTPVFTSLFIAAGTAVRGALGWRSMLGEAMIRAMLGRHRCPSCGYDLRWLIDAPPPAGEARGQIEPETEPETETNTEPPAGAKPGAIRGTSIAAGPASMATCPECGGCWRMDRLGTTTPPMTEVVIVSWR
ncbi:MAG: hypothetical protein ACK5XO_01610 [Phycisphaerales bacterium]